MKGYSTSDGVQRGGQCHAQAANDGGQGFWRKFVLLEKCQPQRLARSVVCKLVRQADWQRFRNCHTPSFKRGLDRLGHQLGVQSFSFQQHRSEEHTSELQSLMRISYAVFCLKKKKK